MYNVENLWAFIQSFYANNVQPLGMPKNLTVDSYGYTVQFAAFNQQLANAASVATQGITINTNADFWLLGIRYTWQGTVALAAQVQIIDTGSQKPFWSVPMPLATVAAPAGGPLAGAVGNSGPLATEAWPRLLPANTTLSITLTGQGGSSDASTCNLALIGVNVKNFGQAAQFVQR